MDKCEKCGFLECRCPDHVAQNYVSKADLRELVESLYDKGERAAYDEEGNAYAGAANMIENLLRREDK